MNNIDLYEILYNKNIDKYITINCIISLFIYLYFINCRGLIFRTYFIYVWFNVSILSRDLYHRVYSLSNIIFNDTVYTVNNIIDKNRKISYLLKNDIGDVYSNIVRTDKLLKYEPYDLLIKRNIDITRLIPNMMSANRWSLIINEVEPLINNVHRNILYVEMPMIIDKFILDLNECINPWKYLYLDLITDYSTKIFIKIPITYSVYDYTDYYDKTSYIEISLLTFSIIIGYIIYKLVSCFNKKKEHEEDDEYID
jgi:hypothetical protein